MRSLVLLLMPMVFLAPVCGEAQVKTADDAAIALRKILNGADPADFELAAGASSAARRILADGQEVNRLKGVLAMVGEKGCDVADIAATVGEQNDDGISISAEARDQILRQLRESDPDWSENDLFLVVNPVLEAVEGLTQAGVTETLSKACQAASDF